MPCQPNTISVMMAPPSTAAKSRAMTVVTGISALRSTWRKSTRRGLRALGPRQADVVASSVSIIDDRW